MHRRHLGIQWMGDERDAACPELAARLGAGNLLGEFGGELSVYGRAVDARLLEQAAMHHRRDAATPALPLPGTAPEAAGRPIAVEFVLEALQCCTDVIAQALEPSASAFFPGCDGRFGAHERSGGLIVSCISYRNL